MMAWEAVFPAADAAACLFLGLFVMSRSPRKPVNRLFMGLMAAAAAAEYLAAFSLATGLHRSIAWTFRPWATLFVLSLCLASTFTVVFGRREAGPGFRRWAIPLTLQAVLGAGVVAWAWMSQSHSLMLSGNVQFLVLPPGARWFLLYVTASLLLIIYRMERLFSESAGQRRWRIKLAVLGVIALCFFVLLETGFLMSNPRLRADMIATNSFVFLVSQGLLFFSIVRHRLLDVEIFISREVTFRAFLTAVGAAYLAGVSLFAYWSGAGGGGFRLLIASGGAFILVVAGGALALSEHVRNSVRHFINTHFYKNKYEYRSRWNSFTRHLGTIDDIRELGRVTLMEICETMWVRKGSLWIRQGRLGGFTCLAFEEVPRPLGEIRADGPLARSLADAGDPVTVDLLRQRTLDPNERSLLDEVSAEVCAPLVVRDTLVGFITLGPNLFSQSFDFEDHEMLSTLCCQTAATIYRHLLAEELATARGLDSLARVSSFIVHDLKNAVSMLSMVVQNASENIHKPEFQKDAMSTIRRSVEKMKRLVERFSFPVEEPGDPFLKPVALNDLLENSIERLQLRRANGVRVECSYADLPPLMLDADLMDRLFDNLLINALQSLPPTGGTISVASRLGEGGTAFVEVADTGCGIPSDVMANELFKPFHTTKKKGLGIGLYHARNIVTAHGGAIEVESREQHGTIFRVSLPGVPQPGPDETISGMRLADMAGREQAS